MTDYKQTERIEDGETFQIITFEYPGHRDGNGRSVGDTVVSEMYRFDKTEDEIQDIIAAAIATI